MAYHHVSRLVIIMIIGFLVLAGCSSSDNDGIAGTGMQGTVAVGKAVANADISIKGKAGKKVSSTTDVDGKYNIDVAELTAPYIIQVKVSETKILYGVALSVGTANVHPLTDIVIRNWFVARNRLIDNEFAHDNGFDVSPTTTEIDVISNALTGLMSIAYQEFNVADNFDFIQTAFDVDQTGFDGLLDHVIVIVKTNTLEIRLIDQTTNIEGHIVAAFDLNNELTTQDSTAPTAPEGLVAIAAKQTSNVVVWNSAQDNLGVAGYHVYRDGIKVGTVSAPVFTDSGLTASTQYCYKVEAFDGAGNLSNQTAENCVTTLAQADTQAPDAPSNLAISTITEHVIALTWTPSASADIIGYHINRRTTEFNSTRIASVVANAYSDFERVSGTQYCYSVLAFDAAGNVSALSNEVCETTMGETAPDTTAPVSTASPNGGSFVSARSVSLACSDDSGIACAAIYYTLDGSEPSMTSAQYNESINIDATTTLKFFGVDAAGNQESPINSVTFTIGEVACTDELPRTIDKDTTISAACTLVPNRVSVVGALLTIEAGATLVFQANAGIDVRADGALRAVGTEAQPILLTGQQKTPGYWEGLQFTFSNDVRNELAYVTIEYGGHNTGNGQANVIMYGGSGNPQRLKISNSILRASSNFGFQFNTGSIVQFSNNVMIGNEAGPGELPANIVGKLDAASQYSGNVNDLLLVADSSIDDDQTWAAIDVDYSVGSHTINANLVIAAGARLRFRADGDFNVRSEGSLKAVGTAEKRIVFTGDQPTPGYWDGIQFTFSNSINNELDYVTVEYGGAGINGKANVMMYGGGSNDQRLKLTNSILRYSANYGFQFDTGSVLDAFANNTFENNETGAGRLPGNVVRYLDSDSSYSGNVKDIVYVESDTIENDQTWPAIDAEYLTENQSVEAAWTIAAGATLVFRSDDGINVRSDGSLTAIGDADNMITFTAEQQSPGYWMGIEFTFSNNINNRLEHVIVDYAGGLGGNGNGAVRLYGSNSNASRAAITNSTVRFSQQYGVWLAGDSIIDDTEVTTTNTFADNANGDFFRAP